MQTYKALSDFAMQQKLPEPFLLISILSSLNSVAAVVMMFFEGKATKQIKGKTKWAVYLGLYLYHLLEVTLRTATFALFGLALGRYSFVAAGCSLLFRLLIKLTTKDPAPLGLAVASVFLDSAFEEVPAFRASSAASMVEGVAAVLFVVAPGFRIREGAKYSLEHHPGIATLIWTSFLGCACVRVLLHTLIMERHSKFCTGKNKDTALEHDVDATADATEIAESAGAQNPLAQAINVLI